MCEGRTEGRLCVTDLSLKRLFIGLHLPQHLPRKRLRIHYPHAYLGLARLPRYKSKKSRLLACEKGRGSAVLVI